MRTVRKGWLFGYGAKPVRVIQETRHGHVFWPGGGGWRQLHDHERIVLLPPAFKWEGWLHSQWWNGLWRRPEWAWLYGAP